MVVKRSFLIDNFSTDNPPIEMSPTRQGELHFMLLKYKIILKVEFVCPES